MVRARPFCFRVVVLSNPASSSDAEPPSDSRGSIVTRPRLEPSTELLARSATTEKTFLAIGHTTEKRLGAAAAASASASATSAVNTSRRPLPNASTRVDQRRRRRGRFCAV